MKKILIVDDEPNFLILLDRTLQDEGYQIVKTEKSQEALSAMESQTFDLVITDLAMPDIDGIELMQRIKKIYPSLPFIIITGVGTVEKAVEAMKQGAYDFITKPFELDLIHTNVKRALEYGELHRELNYLRKEIQDKYIFSNIIAKTKSMQNIFKLIEQVADSTATVLIQGESGTGKELLARAIHFRSSRKNKPFLAIDCNALSEPLLESELFGHTKGAFTGAIHARRGLFEEASEGTIFLDEVGDIPLSTQSKLLRVIQEREVKPVGSNFITKVDVRIITATNKDLKELIQKQSFREDLYYRIAVVPIYLPPLRERKEDIPLLSVHFIKKYNDLTKKKINGLSREALLALSQHDWPGNVRELENILERAILICNENQITPQHLFINQPMTSENEPLVENDEKSMLSKAVEKSEKDYILQVLHSVNFNRTRAAKVLGISRRTLYDKIEKYNLKDNSMFI